MELKINNYFEECKGEILINKNTGEPYFDKWGNVIITGAKPPTVTGLALALGFNSRQTLLNYQGDKEFMDAITRAKSKVQEYAETRLFDRDGARGAEFPLRCNFKWRDKEDADNPESGVQIVDDL